MHGANIRIPRTLPLGAGEAKKQAIKQQWDTVGSVMAELEAKGLRDSPRPTEECPRLTADLLTGNDSRSYTETYVLLNAWFTYYTELQAQVRANIIQYENMQAVLAAQTRKIAKEINDNAGVKKPTEAELNERLLLNPEYLEVTLELQKYQQARLSIDAKVDGVNYSL